MKVLVQLKYKYRRAKLFKSPKERFWNLFPSICYQNWLCPWAL